MRFYRIRSRAAYAPTPATAPRGRSSLQRVAG